MKTGLLSIILIALLPLLAFSQKNDISTGVFYCQNKYGDYIIEANISYFKNVSSNSSIGIIIDANQYKEKEDQYYKNWNGRKDLGSILTLMYKNNFYNKGRSSLHYGGGLTAGTRIIYYKTIPKILICGNGLPQNWEPPKPPNHWNFEYFSGISALFEYQYRIINKFYMGIDLRGILVYDFEYEEVSTFIIPTIAIGYKW